MTMVPRTSWACPGLEAPLSESVTICYHLLLTWRVASPMTMVPRTSWACPALEAPLSESVTICYHLLLT